MTDQTIMHRYTSIGRTLDPTNPTNALIMILAVLGGLVSGAAALLLNGHPLNEAFWAGIWTGATTFVAWVLTREIDPDYPYSAFVAAGLALAGSLWAGAPGLPLLLIITLIITLRLINRVVGPPFHWIDSFALLALAVLLAAQGQGLAAVAVGAAFAIDALMRPALRRHLVFAVAAAGAGLIALAGNPPAVARPEGMASNVLFAIVLAFGFLLMTTHHIRSAADVPGYTLSVARVQAAMVWLLVVAVLAAFTTSADALLGFLPVWTALAGAALYRAVALALKAAEARL